MTFPPPFSSEGIRKVLGPDEESSANGLAQRQRMAELDQAELRDLERAEYDSATPVVIEDATTATTTRRSILDRLFRR